MECLVLLFQSLQTSGMRIREMDPDLRPSEDPSIKNKFN